MLSYCPNSINGNHEGYVPILSSHRKMTCSVDTSQTAGLWLKKNNLSTQTC